MPAELTPETTAKIVNSTLDLHNMLYTRHTGLQVNEADQEDADGNVVLGAW